MSCPTRPGPKTYVDFIHATTGHTITGGDWHKIKTLIESDGVPDCRSRRYASVDDANKAANRLVSAVDPVPDFARVRAEYNALTRRLDEIEDIENPTEREESAAAVTRSRLRTLKRQLEDLNSSRIGMLAGVKKTSHTEGNIGVINYLSEHGVSETLAKVRGASAEAKQKHADRNKCQGMSELTAKSVLKKAIDEASPAVDGYAIIGGYVYTVSAPTTLPSSETPHRNVKVYDSWGDSVHETTGLPASTAEGALSALLATDDDYRAGELLERHGLTVKDVFEDCTTD